MPHFNKNYWAEDRNQEPSYIYLIEAVGYHGWLPGCVLKRVKIGLSRNPQARLDTFHSNQPPCDLKIIKTIYVENMSEVETTLHHQFKRRNVKLTKSREYFDLYPHQYAMVLWAFSRYESHRVTFEDIPKRAIVGGLIVLMGLGMLIGQGIKEDTPQPMTTTEQR